MTDDEARRIVGALFAAFPSARTTEATPGLYMRMLADVDYQVARKAVDRLIRTATFLPSIAEIRAAAVDVAHGEEPAALLAWASVCDQIRRVGVYQRPRFADTIVAQCVSAIGWQHLCKSGNDASDRARFCELYSELSRRRRRDMTIAAIGGGERMLTDGDDTRALPRGAGDGEADSKGSAR